MKRFSLVLSYGNFKPAKVKIKIINDSPTHVYKWLEAIECLHWMFTHTITRHNQYNPQVQ